MSFAMTFSKRIFDSTDFWDSKILFWRIGYLLVKESSSLEGINFSSYICIFEVSCLSPKMR